MAAKFNHIAVLVLGALVGESGYAQHPSLSPMVTPVTEQMLAKQRLTRAVAKLEEKTAECVASRVVLPAQLVSGLDISSTDLKKALVYFHARAENKCVEREASEYVVASTLVRQIEVGASAESRDILDLSRLATESLIDEIQKEVDYLSLPEDARRGLESIPELKQPFDLLKSAKNMGLY